ncbi:choice-of-anchor J domain-containing protein [Cryomorphaceae bacterium 1068]|nr:choice-of-anchor J domain-containing protein [Cryomorphaceae bacterium 1068]
MNKVYLLALAILGFGTMQAQLYFDDFEGNSLEGYTLYNLDGLTPDDPDLDTMADSAWTIRNITSQGWEFGLSAFSVSWYANDEGPSDDWLVTPGIAIGEGAILEWDAMAITSSGLFRDRYQVFISSSPELDDLGLLAPEFTMGDTGEVDFPIHRTLDLGALGYANETIYVAFRNNTQPFVPGGGSGPGNGGNELAIDNIEVNDETTLSVSKNETFEYVRVQPNPVAQGASINLSVSLNTSETISIEVMNISGKIHTVISNRILPAGPNLISIDRNGLAQGIYFLRLRAGENTSVVRTVLN